MVCGNEDALLLNPCHSIDEGSESDLFGSLPCFFSGFTKFTRAEHLKYKSEGRIALAPDGEKIFRLLIYLCPCLSIICFTCEELILNNFVLFDVIPMYGVVCPFGLWACL